MSNWDVDQVEHRACDCFDSWYPAWFTSCFPLFSLALHWFIARIKPLYPVMSHQNATMSSAWQIAGLETFPTHTHTGGNWCRFVRYDFWLHNKFKIHDKHWIYLMVHSIHCCEQGLLTSHRVPHGALPVSNTIQRLKITLHTSFVLISESNTKSITKLMYSWSFNVALYESKLF